MRLSPLLLALLLSCNGPFDSETDGGCDTDTGADTDTGSTWNQPEGGNIVLEMFDGVRVNTIYRPASQPGRPSVLMMACSPVGTAQYQWPPRLIEDLVARDWAVLIPEMRGCGRSEGDWQPLLGPVGINDIDTFATKLEQDEFGPLSIITGLYIDGAVVAYTQKADRGELPISPVAIGLLTSYSIQTESLTPLSSLDTRPILFQYLFANKAWPNEKRRENPGSWEFIEYDTNLLDRGLFVQNPNAADDLVDFLDRSIPE
ncbi:MAG: hypothetical protein AB8H79_15090 [Myxococcota bacterium]